MKHNSNQLTVVLMIVLLGFIGNSIAYPILAPALLHPASYDLHADFWWYDYRSIVLGATLMMYPLGQFIGSCLLGSLSDQMGRKRILLISTLSMACFYAMTAMSLAFFNIWLLILSRFLTGLCEGNISLARAIVTDHEDWNQHRALGLINAMSAIGYIIGPLLGGVLSDSQISPWFNDAFPFYIAAALSIALAGLIMVSLAESHSLQAFDKQQFMQRLHIIRQIIRVFSEARLKYILYSITLASLAFDTYYEFYPAIMTHDWHATPMLIALYTIAFSITLSIGCVWLSPLCAKLFPWKKVLIVSMLVNAAMILTYIVCSMPIVVLALFIVLSLGIAVATTHFNVMVAERSPAAIKGEVFGTVWGVRMLLDALMSAIGGVLLMLSIKLPLVVAVIACLASMLVLQKDKKLLS